MRVLWFTTIIPPPLAETLGIEPTLSGSWVPALAEVLSGQRDVELAIACATGQRESCASKVRNVQYYVIPKVELHGRNGILPVPLRVACQRLMQDFKPDVMHIHGTESGLGLLSGRHEVTAPTVISIQGLISQCAREYWGGMSAWDVIRTRTLRDWLRLDGLMEQRVLLQRRARWEKEVILGNRSFIGRTLWDRAHLRSLNPTARYYHCEEVLRPAFYVKRWSLDACSRYRIFCSSALYPLKGFHIVLRAAAILRREFPQLQVRVPAPAFVLDSSSRKALSRLRWNGYRQYLAELIRKERLEDAVVFLPTLTADQMAEELQKAHVFVLPSLMENSPNSLAEAMMVGTPCVVSHVGGVGSLSANGQAVRLVPPGDPPILAEEVREVFNDDLAARGLSERARAIAEVKYSKTRIGDVIRGIYEDVIQQATNERGCLCLGA